MSVEQQATGGVARGAARARGMLTSRRSLWHLDRHRPGILIAEGDSWFHYPGTDVLSVLEDRHGWEVYSVAHFGDTLESMAYDERQLRALLKTFEAVAARRAGEEDPPPVRILLSGGGNDFAGPELAMLLEHQGTGRGGINEVITTELVERRMREAWENLLGFTRALSEELLGGPVPTVLHGYDYPVPDGRGYLGGIGPLPGPWLAPSYARKNLGSAEPAGVEERRALTKDLLLRYNAMLATVVDQPGLEHVRHVELLDTLQSADYRDDWANELHPTARGFEAVAEKIHQALQS